MTTAATADGALPIDSLFAAASETKLVAMSSEHAMRPKMELVHPPGRLDAMAELMAMQPFESARPAFGTGWLSLCPSTVVHSIQSWSRLSRGRHPRFMPCILSYYPEQFSFLIRRGSCRNHENPGILTCTLSACYRCQRLRIWVALGSEKGSANQAVRSKRLL